MKILFLTDGIHPFVIGGMQKHSYYLIKYFLQNGVKVTLVHPTVPGATENALRTLFQYSSLLDVRLIDPVRLPRFPFHYLVDCYWFSRKVYTSMASILSEYDFVYAQGFSGFGFVGRSGCPPVGVHFHGLESFQDTYEYGAKTSIYRKLFQKSTIFIASRARVVFMFSNSKDSKLFKYLVKMVDINNKILRSPNGVDGSWLNPTIKVSTEHRKFLFVGRYERRKGIEELSDVIKNGHFEADFGFIGPIPDSLHLNLQNVHYFGAIREETRMRELMTSYDALICPSYAEGMPTVILEAMANGLAIIATDVGAVSDLVSDENGWLISAGNITQLRDSIQDAIAMDSAALHAKKSASRQKVEQFTWDKVGRETINGISDYLARLQQ